MKWLQDQNQSSVDDNLNSVRGKANRRRGTGVDYLKARTDKLETNSKIKNITLALEDQ